MITKHKDINDAPTTEVVEVKTEGVICESVLDTTVQDYGCEEVII